MSLRGNAIPILALAYRKQTAAVGHLIDSLPVWGNAGTAGITVPRVADRIGDPKDAAQTRDGLVAVHLLEPTGTFEAPPGKGRPAALYVATPALAQVITGFNDKLLDTIVGHIPGSTHTEVTARALSKHGVSHGLRRAADPDLVLARMEERGQLPEVTTCLALGAFAVDRWVGPLVNRDMERMIRTATPPPPGSVGA